MFLGHFQQKTGQALAPATSTSGVSAPGVHSSTHANHDHMPIDESMNINNSSNDKEKQ